MIPVAGSQITDRFQPVVEAVVRLWRNRTITLLVTLSLALGIGANTAIFTLVDALFLAPLPVEDPSRLFALFTKDPRNPGPLAVSFPNYQDLKSRLQSFKELAASTDTRVNLGLENDVHEVSSEMVTPNYFLMAGVTPKLGTTSVSAEPEGESTQYPSLVISHALWRKRFASDPGVLGRIVTINKMPFSVAGVMPASFKGFEKIGSTDLWLPMKSYRAALERPDWITGRRALMFDVIGRLKPGVSAQAASLELDEVGKKLAGEFPMENYGRSFSLMSVDEASVGPERRGSLIRAALVLMSGAGAVLLIAIANIGNVLLSRASGRRREMAVRLAMGATRRKLLYQVMIESGLLLLLGGSLGLLLGLGGRELLWRLRPEGISPEDLVLRLNGRVLAFAVLLSLLTGALANLLPALQSLRGDITGELRERIRNKRTGWRLRLREGLVVFQIALSLVALVGADLFLESLRNAQAIDPGFDTRNIATFDVNPRRLGLGPSKRLEFYRDMQEKLAAIPGVHSVSIASNPLLGEGTLRRTVNLDGSSKDGVIVRVNMISERYFETSDVLILRGRDFHGNDKYDAPLVAIVNETMARRFWPNDSALGKTFRLFGERSDHTVIGVARDSVYNTIGETPEPCLFLPVLQTMPPTATVLVRTAGDPSLLTKALATAVRQFHPGLPAVEVVPVRQAMDQALWAPRMAAALLTVFGLLALALASIGVYGVTGHMVSQRTGELGVRMALGACPMDVMELILRQCLTLILPGLAIGTVVSLALAHFCFQNLLYGVSETEFEPYLVASLLLSAVALVASYLPARRAVGMHPVMALREQ